MSPVCPPNMEITPQHPSALHGLETPSAWIRRWTPLLRPGSRVLDVACGKGRHTRWFTSLGHPVTCVDRNAEAIDALRTELPPVQVDAVLADIENGPWPFDGRDFDAVIVTNYLWRPLWPRILRSVAPGGVLLYETFAAGNETVGRPSRPDFLLEPGELLSVCQGTKADEALHVVAYENGFLPDPPRFVQRLAAVRATPGEVTRHPLA